MKYKKVLFIEYGIVILLTILAIFNTRLELFDTPGLLGGILSGISLFFLPGHIGAMVVTNAADPPGLWGVIVCYSMQGLLVAFLGRKITLLIQKKRRISE